MQLPPPPLDPMVVAFYDAAMWIAIAVIAAAAGLFTFAYVRRRKLGKPTSKS